MRRRLPLLLALLIAASPAWAAPTSAELNKVEADQREREQERDAARAQSQDAAKAVADLQRQLVALAAAQTKGEREVKGKRETLAALNLRETALTAKMGDNRHELARLLGALQLFKRDPPPALFVHPRDAKDAVRAAILIRALEPELERRAKAFREEAEEIKRLRREAAGASAELFTAESDVADRRAKIEALIAQKTALQRQAAADALIADRDVQALAARAKSLRELLAGLPAAEAPLAPGQAPPPNPETAGLFGGAKAFVQPVEGALVRRFGEAQPDRARGQGKSLGWTWRADKGAQVLAPAAGVVEYAGPLKGWGVILILRLGGGYHLVLAGLETVLAGPEGTVAAGEPVGRMAEPGPSELYFEIRKDGTPVDPARWLKSPGAQAAGR